MYHQDDLLWGKGSTDKVTRVVVATRRTQREKGKADTTGVGLVASFHADLMQTAGLQHPEERQKPLPARQLKPKPKPTPNPAPKLEPRQITTSAPEVVMISVPTLTRHWKTVPPPNQKKTG